jgi:hypothetical protein
VAESSQVCSLELGRLREGYPCLTPESGLRLARAGSICLEERKHTRGVSLGVTGDYKTEVSLGWPETNEQVRREWSDPQEATENGACGIAILLVGVLTDYHVVQRSWKGTGFDYWLGLKDDLMFQNAARLEVSGIRKGGIKLIESRVNTKMNQVKRSDSLKIPAFVVVVEFDCPIAAVHKRDAP